MLAQNALWFGEAFSPPQDGEIEAAVFFAVSFPFSFKFHKCRVAQQTGGSEIEI